MELDILFSEVLSTVKILDRKVNLHICELSPPKHQGCLPLYLLQSGWRSPLCFSFQSLKTLREILISPSPLTSSQAPGGKRNHFLQQHQPLIAFVAARESLSKSSSVKRGETLVSQQVCLAAGKGNYKKSKYNNSSFGNCWLHQQPGTFMGCLHNKDLRDRIF